MVERRAEALVAVRKTGREREARVRESLVVLLLIVWGAVLVVLAAEGEPVDAAVAVASRGAMPAQCQVGYALATGLLVLLGAAIGMSGGSEP